MTTARVSNSTVFVVIVYVFAVAFAPSPCPAQPSAESVVRSALETAAAALDDGDAHEALTALTPIDAIEPRNPWLWYYRGRARAVQGFPHESIEAFDRALDSLTELGDPDPPLAEKIRSDRWIVRRKIANVSLRLGLAYDSNVTFSGGGTTGPFITGRGDGEFSSLLLWDYAPLATPNEMVTIGGHLANSWHFSIDEFDYQDYGAFVRYTRPLDSRWTLELEYAYDFTLLGNDSFLSRHAVTPSLTYRWEPSGKRLQRDETRIEYRIAARDFLYPTDPEFDRDGFVNSVGISQTFRFKAKTDPLWIWDLYAGYIFQYVATEGSEFDRNANIFTLGVEMPLRNPWMPEKKALLRFWANWEIDDYRNRSLIDRAGRHRDDVITTFGLVLSQYLSSDALRGDLILHLIVNWSDSDSNVRDVDRSSPFTYDKTVAGFQLEWRF